MVDLEVVFLALRRRCSGQQSLRRLAVLRCRSTRRKVLLVFILSTFLMRVMTEQMPRMVWSFQRASTWWETIVNSSFTLRDWLENFRVSHETCTCVTSYGLVLADKQQDFEGQCLYSREWLPHCGSWQHPVNTEQLLIYSDWPGALSVV